MADPITWDLTLLVPCKPQSYLKPFNTGGGRNALGAEKVMSNAPPRWRIVLGDINLTAKEQIKKFRSIATKLEGRANPIFVPLCEQGREAESKANLFDDDLGFDDDTSFDDDSPFGGSVVARAKSAVAIGAATCVIETALETDLAEGDIFGDGLGRAYVIKEVTSVDVSGTYPAYTVKISPPVRQVIAAAQSLEIRDITVRCILESDDGMAMPALDLWRLGNVSVTFVEDV